MSSVKRECYTTSRTGITRREPSTGAATIDRAAPDGHHFSQTSLIDITVLTHSDYFTLTIEVDRKNHLQIESTWDLFLSEEIT